MPYSKSGYVNLRYGLQRHLTSPPHNRKINISNDVAFKQANNVFKGQLKTLKIQGMDKTQHKSSISDSDLKTLQQHFSQCKHTPKCLQDKVLFDILFFFGRRGREGLRNFKTDSFVFQKDGSEREYATLSYNEFDKNHADLSVESEETDKRMYAQPGDDNCPVASLKVYISHLNDKNAAFFQRPNNSFAKSPNPSRWYDNMPLGKGSLGQFMPRISREANLSKRYTNHCVRASTITILKHSGFSNRDICSVTGHKREESLAHYCAKPSDQQKNKMSEILFSKVAKTTPEKTENAPSVQERDVIISEPISVTSNVNHTNQNLSIPVIESEVRSLFAGAAFHGTVNFTINFSNQ